MTKVSLAALLLASLLGTGCAGLAKQAAGRTWHKAGTGRFSVLTSGDPEQARKLVQDLERFHDVMRERTTFEDRMELPPVRIYLASNWAEYQALGGPERSGGVFKPTARGNFALVTLAFGECRGRTNTHIRCRNVQLSDAIARARLFHEYVHYIEAVAGSPTPSWYKEGLAEYMETTSFGDGGTYTLGCAMEWRAKSQSFRHWVPLETLMTSDNILHIEEGNADTYGQAWAAMHYFLADAARAQRLNRFLQLRAHHVGHGEAVQEAFQMTSGELDEQLRSYAGSWRFKCLEVTPAVSTEPPEPRVRELSSAEAHVNLGELLLHTLGPTAPVMEVLEEGVRQGPNDARMLAAIAHAHLLRAQQPSDGGADADRGAEAGGQEGGHTNPAPHDAVAEMAKASAYLKRAKAAVAKDASALAAPYVAVVEGHLFAARAAEAFRAGAAGATKALSVARKSYRRAIRADEGFAEAYVGLGKTYLLNDNGSKEPIGVLEAASYLLPLSTEAPIALAQLHINRRQFAEAEAPLRYALQVSAHSGQQELLESLLRQVEAAR